MSTNGNFAYFMETEALTKLGIRFVLVQDRDAVANASFKGRAEAWVNDHGGRVTRWRRREAEYLPLSQGPKIAQAMTAAEIREMDQFYDAGRERHEIVDLLSELALTAGSQ